MTTSVLTVLPRDILERLDKIELSKVEKNHCLKFIDNLIKRSYRKTGTIDSFIETPKRYIEKITNKRYYIWLDKLVKNSIINQSNHYSNLSTNIFSKSYSINTPPFPIMCPTFDENSFKSVSYTYKKHKITDEQKYIKDLAVEDIKKLKMDYENMISIINKEIENISISNFTLDEEIEETEMPVTFREYKKEAIYWMKKDMAISKAKENKSRLIKDDNRYYIMDATEFLLMKKRAMYLSYKDAVIKLDKKYYFANRNSTNNRLDTNITNMSNILTNELCRHNNLIKLDLCNAQFAILSHILEEELNTSDFRIFRDKSYEGLLYEYIMEKLETKDRKSAKIMMFELMFSKETLNSSNKNRLKEIFPSVVEAVDYYKTEYGYEKFSVMLQQKESEIFIDGLWKKIKRKKIFCITKHDCLIIKEEDLKEVLEVVENQFKKLKFKGKIVQESLYK